MAWPTQKAGAVDALMSLTCSPAAGSVTHQIQPDAPAPNHLPASDRKAPDGPVTVRLSTPATDRRMPPISIGLPCGGDLGPGIEATDESDKRGREPAERALCEALRDAGCRYIFTRYSRLQGHDLTQLQLYKRLAERADMGLILELVIDAPR